jgi:hypothetical protein
MKGERLGGTATGAKKLKMSRGMSPSGPVGTAEDSLEVLAGMRLKLKRLTFGESVKSENVRWDGMGVMSKQSRPVLFGNGVVEVEMKVLDGPGKQSMLSPLYSGVAAKSAMS